MKVIRIQQGPVTVLAVRGPMVEDELDPLDSNIDECKQARQLRVVLDLSEVPYIDSAGLERFQSLMSDIGKLGGDLRIAALNEVCSEIFQATRLDSFLQVFENRESAVRSLL